LSADASWAMDALAETSRGVVAVAEACMTSRACVRMR